MSLDTTKWENNNVDELYELFIKYHTPGWRRINVVSGVGDNYFCDNECDKCKCKSFCSDGGLTGNWYFEDQELINFKKSRPELFI